jgi:3'-phosphoadenosine 5'-phosphosulfate sulfotransferase (PAPS reductase)/FAD synthetase
MSTGRVRHVLSLSGGKDSTALAIYLRDRIPDMEYVFCDTRKELPETYEYLRILEAYLGKKIVRLKDNNRGFEHHLLLRNGYLPSTNMRWCTEELKIKPYERYVCDDNIISYIGIRADENRQGYISRKPNIRPVYPFKEEGITRADVYRILESSGLGMPSYYRWRSRSGCFFCFFQQKIEWVGLLENHPDLFEEAKRYEKANSDHRFTWSQGESLDELERPERIEQIRAEHARRMEIERSNPRNRSLVDVFSGTIEAWQSDVGCTICEL